MVSPSSTNPAAASAVMTLFRLTASSTSVGSRQDQRAPDDLASIHGLVGPAGLLQPHASADLGLDVDGARTGQTDQRGHVTPGPPPVGAEQADRAAHHVGDP